MTGKAALALGNVTVHRVIDLDPFALPLDMLFPGATLAQLLPVADLLGRDHVDFAAGKILLAIQSHLLRFAGKTILIDACVGEHKSRPLRPEWNARSGTRYLAHLAAAGCAPEDIDHRHVHASACRPCRLEHAAGIGPLAADLSQRPLCHEPARDRSARAGCGAIPASQSRQLSGQRPAYSRGRPCAGGGSGRRDRRGHDHRRPGGPCARPDRPRCRNRRGIAPAVLRRCHPQPGAGLFIRNGRAASASIAPRRFVRAGCCCNGPRARICCSLPAHLRGAGMRIAEKGGAFVPAIEP